MLMPVNQGFFEIINSFHYKILHQLIQDIKHLFLCYKLLLLELTTLFVTMISKIKYNITIRFNPLL